MRSDPRKLRKAIAILYLRYRNARRHAKLAEAQDKIYGGRNLAVLAAYQRQNDIRNDLQAVLNGIEDDTPSDPKFILRTATIQAKLTADLMNTYVDQRKAPITDKGYNPPDPVPETMVSWDGESDDGPKDWDGGQVYFRMGRLSDPGEGPQSDEHGKYTGVGNWFHGPANDSIMRGRGAFDVIFYNRRKE